MNDRQSFFCWLAFPQGMLKLGWHALPAAGKDQFVRDRWMSKLARIAGVVSVVATCSPTMADLPPRYYVWNEWQAIMEMGEIPGKLGYVERIEEVWDSTFRLYSGKCYLDAVIEYRDTAAGTGHVVMDSFVISGVKLGDVICDGKIVDD